MACLNTYQELGSSNFILTWIFTTAGWLCTFIRTLCAQKSGLAILFHFCISQYQDLEERLTSQHLENMSAQIQVHKSTIDTLEEAAKQDKVTALDDMTRQTQQNIGKVISIHLVLGWGGRREGGQVHTSTIESLEEAAKQDKDGCLGWHDKTNTTEYR